MQSVVSQLQKERTRLEDELQRVTVALTAFGKATCGKRVATRKRRTISAAGRKENSSRSAETMSKDPSR
jgi:hypothetical protein